MKRIISLILSVCLLVSLFGATFSVSAATTSTSSAKTVQLVLNSDGTAFKVPDGVTVYVGDTIKFDPNAELLINGTPTKLSSLDKINVHYDRENYPIKYQYYTTDPGRPTYLETLRDGEFVVDIAGNYYSQVQWWIDEVYYDHTYFETFSAVERPASSKVIDMVLNENGTAFKIPDGVTVYVGDTIKFDTNAELLINSTPTKLSSLDKINVHYDRENYPIKYQYYTTDPGRPTYLETLRDGEFVVDIAGNYYSQVQWWIDEVYYDHTYFETFSAVERPASSKVIDMVLNENGTAFKIPDGVTVNVGDTVRFDVNAEIYINGFSNKLSSFEKYHVHFDEYPLSAGMIYQYFTTNPESNEYLPSLKENGSFPITREGKYYSQVQWWVEEEGFSYSYFEPFEVSETAVSTKGTTADGFKYENFGSFCVVTGYSGNASSITIPSHINSIPVYEIGEMAFTNSNTTIKEVTISNGIKGIGPISFYTPTLKKINIPKSVLRITYDSFYYCPNLEEITVEEGSKLFKSSGNCLIKTSTKTLIKGTKNSVIPSDGSVTVLGEYCFYSVGITDIEIPNTVTTIQSGAFMACENLTQLIVPDSVTTIDPWAFSESPNLEVEIHDSVKNVNAVSLEGVKKILCYDNSTVCNLAKQNDIPYEIISPIYGDVTSDKTVDIFDLISLAKYITNSSTVINIRTADVSTNDAVDIFDLIALAKQIVSQNA